MKSKTKNVAHKAFGNGILQNSKDAMEGHLEGMDSPWRKMHMLTEVIVEFWHMVDTAQFLDDTNERRRRLLQLAAATAATADRDY